MDLFNVLLAQKLNGGGGDSTPNLQTKSVSINANTAAGTPLEIDADSGYDALAKVLLTVAVPVPAYYIEILEPYPETPSSSSSGPAKIKAARIVTAPNAVLPAECFYGNTWSSMTYAEIGYAGGQLPLPGMLRNQFRGCASAEDFKVFNGWQYSLNLEYCAALTLASVRAMITAYANNSGATLTLHATPYALLTADDFATATAKGLTIASA